MTMRLQNGNLASFGGRAFGAPVPVRQPVRQMGQPQQAPAATGGPPVAPSGPASAALEAVNQAQQDLRGVERNLANLEKALGPEAALEAFEQAESSVGKAWENYVSAAEEMA